MTTFLRIFFLILIWGFVGNSAFAQSHFRELKVEFENSNQPLTKKDLLGGFLGRCFSPDSDEPIGTILSTVEKKLTKTINQDLGPKYPPSTVIIEDSWRLATYMNFKADDVNGRFGLAELPATSNDTADKNVDNAFWNNPRIAFNGQGYPVTFSELTEVGGVISSQMTAMVEGKPLITNISVKKGTDYLYSERSIDSRSALVTPGPIRYCYFWQKLY